MYKQNTLMLAALASIIAASPAIVVATPTASAASESVVSGISDACKQELTTVRVSITKPVGKNGIRLDNVPPACIDVAKAMVTAIDIDGPPPTQVDSDSVQFDNLSDAEYLFLSGVFDQWAESQFHLIKRHLELESGA